MLKNNINLIFYILIFLLLYSNYTTSTFVYDYRTFFSSIIILLILIRLGVVIKNHYFRKSIFDTPTILLTLSYTILTVLDVAKGLYASAVGCFMFVLIIIIINTYAFNKKYNQIIFINIFNNFFSLIFILIAIWGAYFGGENVRNISGIIFPFFLSYTNQSSLIPALLILPLAIYLLFNKTHKKFSFLYFTILLCFGGNVLVALFSTFVLYFFVNKLTKIQFIIIPFALLLLFVIVLSITGDKYFNQTAELRTMVQKEGLNKDVALDWKTERTISGTERFAFYYDQIVATKNNVLIGSDSTFDFQSLGSLILKFSLRGGISVLILITCFFIILLRELHVYLHFYPNKKIGVALFYSLLIQGFAYNEMGFFSQYAIALLYMAVVMLKFKNKQFIFEQTRIDNGINTERKE